jgi:hypothetical protein
VQHTRGGTAISAEMAMIPISRQNEALRRLHIVA